MSVTNDILRIGCSFLVFLGIVLGMVEIKDKSYTVLYQTIYLSCWVTLLGSLYFSIYLFIFRGFRYSSQYKPPFTMCYVFIHVYGIGLFMFTAIYCILSTHTFSTFSFFDGLFIVFIDDLFNQSDDTTKAKILKFCNAGVASVIIFLNVTYNQTKGDDYMELAEDISALHWVFSVICPIVSPLVFLQIRSTNYCSNFTDAIVDMIQYAIPFACSISVILLTVFHSCLNPNVDMSFLSHINFTSMILLPIAVIPAMYLIFLFLLTKNTLDVLTTFSLATAVKFIYLHAEETSAVWCFLAALVTLLCRLLYSYMHYYKPSNEVRLDSVDSTHMQQVPFSDDTI
jgi:hypothetical protein